MKMRDIKVLLFLLGFYLCFPRRHLSRMIGLRLINLGFAFGIKMVESLKGGEANPLVGIVESVADVVSDRVVLDFP